MKSKPEIDIIIKNIKIYLHISQKSEKILMKGGAKR
jgi:hypothetical protein